MEHIRRESPELNLDIEMLVKKIFTRGVVKGLASRVAASMLSVCFSCSCEHAISLKVMRSTPSSGSDWQSD